MKKFIALGLVLLMNLAALAEEPIWKQFNKTFTVKGGVGIEQFVEAIFQTKKSEWSRDPVFDKANGYFYYSEEGSGHIIYYVSYWNRKDGKKLVLMSYDSSDFGPTVKPISSPWGYVSSWPLENDPNSIVADTGFRAYLYNETTKKLEPLSTPPFQGWTQPKEKHYLLQLPRNGKNITVREEAKQYEYVYHTLKWNGMTFDFERGGNHAFDLYVNDTQGGKTNIRVAPNGKVACTLPLTGSYSMLIDRIENGWCHIVGETVYECEESVDFNLKGSDSGYWIHSSVIGASGMGEGGVTLYASPDAKSKVVYKSVEWTFFNPVEIRGSWLKVRVSGTKKEGWIKSDQICSNPLTNCC